MGSEGNRPAASPLAGERRPLSGDLVMLTKARLSVLVVVTAAFGYLIATKGASRSEDAFSFATFFHMLFGTTLAAFGAAVFNQLMEVEVDARMERTADRPLPANRFPRALAFVIGWLLCAFGLIHLGMKVNLAASSFAAATLLVYLFVYTPLKRISSANTIVGAVSGALPPLIGWTGGGGDPLGAGALFLFGLLFLWQLPHFAAINWIYREEYRRAGFVMWSNDDESGRKTARIALVASVVTLVGGLTFPLASSAMAKWAVGPCGLLGAVLVLLSWKFLRSGERSAARTLFFSTLLFLPAAMIVSYLAWL